jgi:hypothetical protein
LWLYIENSSSHDMARSLRNVLTISPFAGS